MGRPGRPSRFGVTGLYRNEKTGDFHIDLRFRDLETGKPRRYYEYLGKIDVKTARARVSTVQGYAAVGKLAQLEQTGQTVKKSFDAYLKWCATNRPKGLKLRTAQVAIAVAVIGPDRPVAKIAAADIERVKDVRLASLRKRWPGRDALGFNATINRLVVTVRAAAAWMAEPGRAWVDAAAIMALKRVELLPEKPGRVRHLSDVEEVRLFAELGKARAVVGAIAETGILSGLRQGNLVGLRKSWVDLERGVVDLPMTKSGKRHTVYINADLAELLRVEMSKTSARCDWVFVVPGSDPPRPYTGNGLRSIWRRAVRRAEIQDFRFHDLRHTTATRLRENGADLDVIRDTLGHATIQMATRYAHVGQATRRAAMATLSGRKRI